MERQLSVLIFIIIIVILLLFMFLWLYQKTIFSPSTRIKESSSYPKYSEYFIGTKSSKSSTKKIPKEDNINVRLYDNYPGRKIILFFHGNTGNISHRSYIVDICDKFNLNLLLVDYRGYGKSDGKPNTTFLLKDSELSYNFIRTKYKTDEIIVWGESLGGSAAIWVASKYKIRSLVLLSTFSSISDIAEKSISKIKASHGKIISNIINLTGQDLPSHKWIINVVCPTLVIHSKNDTLIPYKLAKKFFNAIGTKNKKLITIKGDHSSPNINDEQFNEIFSFLGIKNHTHNTEEISQRLENLGGEDWN